MNLERRFTRGTLEFRAAKKPGTAGTMHGYAAKYRTLSQNLGGFVETVAAGAFDKSLADGLDVLARYNHDDNMLLGRTASGTLRLASDATGLPYEVDLPDTQVGRDLAVLAERGDVYQSSFAFYTVADSWGQTDQGFPLRTLEQVRLVDVAPVNTPAYLDTEAAVRSLASAIHAEPEDVPVLLERGEVAKRLTRPTVFDLGRRDAMTDALTGSASPTDTAPAAPEAADEHPLNERQCAVEDALESVVEQFGKFDQTSGPNGAHYMADNPFLRDGLACANCAFYDGQRSCEVVSGDIAPDALCKLWVIPSDLIGARSADDSSEVPQVDNHGLTEVRLRLMQMRQNRTT